MEVTRIDLAGGKPTGVQVNMTIVEATFLAWSIGQTNAGQREEILRGGGEAGGGIYAELVSNVFNAFWEDGVDDAVREMR